MSHITTPSVPGARIRAVAGDVPHRAVPVRAVLPALIAALCALTLLLSTAGPARAHDELVRMNPEAGATIAKAPTTLELTFSGSIQDIGSEVRVTDSRGTDVTRGTLAVQNTKVSQPLREGGDTDETYTVTWRVVSQDGHPIEGTFTYSVGEGSGTTASPAPVAEASQGSGSAEKSEDGRQNVSGTGIPSWVLPVVGGVVALVLLLVVLAFATRPKQR
ncbi:copper resistance CopC family protein [Kocuria tytonis]|uniref:Copper resistance protein CopC n=1 Tax=Kocuria tytonis TaxID=2054280 RepID=A0A495A545_9MICC|nr:copper resistance CopC family protein [Kocuria tytonis]RKQ34861.1 copper resistance protein CopC [Kocuria tytonis]